MKKQLSLALTFLCCLLTTQVNATSVLYQSIDNLVTESENIVVGTVFNIKSRKYQNGDVWTVVKLKNASEITENGMVPVRGVVHVRYYGGVIELKEKGEVVGQEYLMAEGTPEFVEGEEVALFLRGNGVNQMPFIGWEQGVFRVKNNQVSNKSSQSVIDIVNGHAVFKSLPNKRKNMPTINGSDGGADEIVNNATIKSAAKLTDAQLNKSLHSPAMDISSFVHHIKETRVKVNASREGKKLGLLDNLPEPKSSNKDIKSKLGGINPAVIDTTPKLPMERAEKSAPNDL
jgi:hypothetical protein